MKYLILSLFLVGCNFNKQYSEKIYNQIVIKCSNGCSSINKSWTSEVKLKNNEFFCKCEK